MSTCVSDSWRPAVASDVDMESGIDGGFDGNGRIDGRIDVGRQYPGRLLGSVVAIPAFAVMPFFIFTGKIGRFSLGLALTLVWDNFD